MTPAAIKKHLAGGKLFPLYLFCGEEDFLAERAVNAMKVEAFRDGDAAFNFSSYWAAEAKQPNDRKRLAADIAASANEFPFLSDRRMIIVRNVEVLAAMEPLNGYLKNPSPSTILVLLTNEKPKKPQKKAMAEWFAILAEHEKNGVGALVEWKIPDGGIANWIIEEGRKYGKTIGEEAAEVMIALKGNSLREIVMELEKLDVAFPDKNEISTEDMLSLVGASRSYTLFNMSDAVLARDTKKSQHIAQVLVGEKQSTSIVRELFRVYIFLWKLKLAPNFKRKKYEGDWRKLGFSSEWQMTSYSKYLGKYPDATYFERCFSLLLDAEVALKSSSNLDDATIISRLVYQLTAGA